MPTLTLVRHAKSSWDDPTLADVERPLAPRGQTDTAVIKSWLGNNLVRPDLVICSSATRTTATWTLLSDAWGQPHPPCTLSDRHYMASAQALLLSIQQVPAAAEHLMMIGHNPGLHELALLLIGADHDTSTGNHATEWQALAAKLPTAGVVVLATPDWSALAPGNARLLGFISPRRLLNSRQ
jgi:phosphohistidine phosphatase